MQEPIAIVGTACRFPGSSSSPSKLWELLKAPRDVVREFPPDRLKFSNFYSNNGEAHGRTDVHQKSYLLDEDIRLFDAAFFRINPKEAAGLDPQHRILLETVYEAFEAFEAAGWPLQNVEGSQTSVHVGVMTDDYYTIQARDPDTLGSHAATGLSRSILSNRVSYAFDLNGPSMTVDTACSSSLVALHLAVQGLRKGEASQAIVAGTNLLLDPHWFITESSLHMLSPDAHSRMWDKDANGYARGEGCAVVVLKPLSKALEDGDHIECIIRETGVNSDGRTNGLTMPSSGAQAALIRQTYLNAGLDPIADRCQYFECHGTGTQAGDPVEARAIRDAFFPVDSTDKVSSTTPLYCGSIKTIIGHTEGCAGLAGLLKASLAIQHKTIPPNLHFNKLNPSVEPFYTHLQVPTSLTQWPETNGRPLRASVNSFGFGGTNAHAIIESFENKPGIHHTTSSALQKEAAKAPIFNKELVGPFVFSARSRSALVDSLERTLDYIRHNPSLDLDALSYVLHSKRTAFSHRLIVPDAANRLELMDSLDKAIVTATNTPLDGTFGVKAPTGVVSEKQPGILGVFTGQGAQTAQMAQQLLAQSPLFQSSIQKCEDTLISLHSGPTWSLQHELAAIKVESRVSEALISQPLCTAIQIALVDLLQAAGIRFDTVVGHSSGEIGAAYAAGLLSVKDAMGIAYYRGLVASLAKGPNGKPGAMMAVSMPFAEAMALCSEARFAGRVDVAASNAPSSSTLSGDLDTIEEVEKYLNEKNIQARKLRVDTAYHSHHMHCCAELYLAYLKQLDVQTQTPPPDSGCVWLSSVLENTNMLESPQSHGLDGQYWLQNMVQPVLFSQAVEFAMKSSAVPFAAALEVGPHPALKGPFGQTPKPLGSIPLPYTGCLERGRGGVETMSSAIGMIWSYLGPSTIDFCGWREAFGLPARRPMLKDMPSYAWNHDKIHWRESRVSKNYRLKGEPPHSLLGRIREDSQYEKTWRNIFHLSEMPWVQGHTFQGQVLFPGAGYVSLAVEAAKSFVRNRPIKVIEIEDMKVDKALVIGEDEGVEILFTIRSKVLPATIQDGTPLEAEFVCYSSSDGEVLDKTCDGRLVVHLGQPAPGDMPPSANSQPELSSLSPDRFHRAVSEIGLVYSGAFRALESIKRSWGRVKAVAYWAADDLENDCTLHPALVDVAFQAGLATFVSTAEKAMESSYLPVGIKRAIIDPNQRFQDELGSTRISIDARMGESNSDAVEVDIDICANSGSSAEACGIQMEGLVLKAIAESKEDRNLFVKTVWDVDCAFGLSAPLPVQADASKAARLTDVYERTTLFYMQNLARQINAEELPAAKWHHRELLRYIDEVVEVVRGGDHPVLQQEWLHDDMQAISELAMEYLNDVDLAMLAKVGENLPSVVRGESEMIEHMLQDDLLSRLYTESAGLAACNSYVADLMYQISHKYPKTKILEIGAGTGGTTLAVLDRIGQKYSSYTCTDISTSFFGGLAEKVAEDHKQKVDFKAFNAEKPPATQGFVERGYDIVLAANVLHATRSLSETVKNARALLKPGGYLIVIEVTGAMLRETGLMGGLEGWWLGVNEGRTKGPGINPKEWDNLLQSGGFSGIDCILYDHPDFSRHSCSVFATQALDDHFDVLRDPLGAVDIVPESPVLIIGGKTLAVSKLARGAKKMLRRWSSNIQTCESIDDLGAGGILPGTFVLSLTDLDKALFSETPTTKRIESLQEMLGGARSMLWVTSGRMLDDPYSNMMVGICRALAIELPHMKIHCLDFEDKKAWDLAMIINQVLRMALFLSTPDGSHDMLWVEEPEVLVKEGQMLVPRVVENEEANENLNATRRRIEKTITPAERIEVAFEGVFSQPVILKSRILDIPETHVAIDVHMSVALHTERETPCFLSFGYLQSAKATESKVAALALSRVDCSSVVVQADSTVILQDSHGCSADMLAQTASDLISCHAFSKLPVRGTVLVCGAPDRLKKSILMEATRVGRKVLFVCVAVEPAENKGSELFINPHAPTRMLRRKIPADVVGVLRFTDADIQPLLKCLPNNCAIQRLDPDCLLQQPVAETIAASFNTNVAEPALDWKQNVMNISEAPQKLSIDRERLSFVLDWTRERPVDAIVQPLHSYVTFSASKTYFLVGMAGELGQSLCRFMLRSGARHIVLASRNPTKDPHWIREFRETGADIRLVKMDVTDRKQVREAVAFLRNNMPEIGGVINAALVFEAGLFMNFSADNIARQLRPKVDGTVNLDREFEKDHLDFFMTFGSLATVCGNPGQALYHAGNLFMASLVEKRRQRGQAASILNFGLLVDVGYVARMDRADGSNIEGTLRSLLLTPLSEAEFHHVVLQGILSGHPDSPSGEVIMGMEPYIDDGTAVARPPWVDKAFFSHMIREPAALKQSAPVKTSQSSMQNLRGNLNTAGNLGDATEAVKELFFQKIEMITKVPKTSIDVNAPLADLGLDSLNAIEIRQWLLKDLQVNMPLLRILGREPISKICDTVALEIMQIREESREPKMDAVHTSRSNLMESPEVSDGRSDIHTPTRQPKPQLTAITGSSERRDSEIQESPNVLTPTTTASSKDETSQENMKILETGADTGITTPYSPSSESPASSMKFLLPQIVKPGESLLYKRTEPLSFAQTGIHFLHNFLDDPTTFNVTTQYTIEGSLNINRLVRAVEKTLARHESYQTCFLSDAGSATVKQYLASKINLDRLVHVVSSVDNAEEDIKRAFDIVANDEYKLALGESLRAVLVTHTPDKHTLVLGFHLLASDALSFSIFLRDLDQAYQLRPFLSKPSSYLDFTAQQYTDLQSDQLEESISYWKQELTPLPAVLPLLPVAHVDSRRARRVYGNHIVERELSGDMAQQIKEASTKCGATSMQFYLATMQVLLARLADIEDICIGVTDSGRGRSPDLVDAVGHFANILPVRFKVTVEQSFEEVISHTALKVLGAFDNAQVPFDVLLERLGIERSPAHTPLFQVAFNYRVGDILRRPLGNCTMTMDKYADVKTPHDLTINITQTATKGHLVECITSDGLYSKSATELIMDTYISLLEPLSRRQPVKLKDCRLSNGAQIQEALDIGRGPSVEHSWPSTLPQRFHQMATSFPDSVAIKDVKDSMTYQQFAHLVGVYAVAMLNANVRSESRIAVLCQPSIDTYATMLAILQIGAVYVPLDMNLPRARLRSITETCQPELLVFHAASMEATSEIFGEDQFQKLNLSELCDDADPSKATVSSSAGNEDSFLLFTSGSTGTPKGIRLGQSGIMNYAASKSTMLDLGQVKVLQQTSVGFDMSIAQAFNAFANGGALIVAPSESRGDPSMISRLILDEDIEFTLCTPSEYLMLTTHAADTLRQCSSWRYACSGGEAVTDRLLNGLRRLELPVLSVTDCYGPTEVSCATTFQNIPVQSEGGMIADERAMPGTIGKAISNTSIYIMSDDGSTLLPTGMPGEICIGGCGVANGYLDIKLTRENFVENPFATPEYLAQGWNIMYKSGDRGILRDDGSVVFLGRSDGDTLVKLRGLRVDLNEVAGAILNAAPDGLLTNAVVTVRGEPQFLVAHVILAPGKQVQQTELDTILRDIELPRYMIPAMIIPLEQFPTTPNGKIDRKALQALALPPRIRKTQDQSALTVPEGELRVIWVDVLGKAAQAANIRAESDFFAVGGSSLLLVRLQHALRERTGVALSLQEMYQATTLRKMAIAMHKERGQLTDETIDWSNEIALSQEFLEAAHAKPALPEPRRHQRQVLLAGSTTFLGGEILRQLITNDDVTKIHCIAVSDDERAKLPSDQSEKIVVYPGSLLQDSLGLSSKETAFLQTNVDQIIDAAVQGHCMNNYTSVRQALYISTRSLVRLALPRRIPFHFVSAPRVILLSGQVEGGPVSMAIHRPPKNGSQGVTASKWASECFLENMAHEAVLPVVIHRHCALIGERAPADDVMNSVIRFSRLSRKAPKVTGARGFFDFKDVAAVASDIAGRVPESTVDVRYSHHSSDVRVPFDGLAQRLSDLYGGEFEVVDPVAWITAAAASGMGDLLAIHLKASMESGQPMDFPYLGK